MRVYFPACARGASTIPPPAGDIAVPGARHSAVPWFVAVIVLLFGCTLIATAQPTVNLTNTTRGGSNLYAGDGFSIELRSGAPNTAVTVTMTKNGSNFGTYPMGTTNTSGSFILTGAVSANEIGAWTETWFVGGVQATPILTFDVLAVTGSITASPNPCTIYYGQSLCGTVVSWSAQGSSDLQIWVVAGSGSEMLFASSGGGTGFSANAPWIEDSTVYVFSLFDYSTGTRGALLGTANVTAIRSDACPY